MKEFIDKTWQNLETKIWSLAIAWMQKIIENEQKENDNYRKLIRKMTLGALYTENEETQKEIHKVKK